MKKIGYLFIAFFVLVSFFMISFNSIFHNNETFTNSTLVAKKINEQNLDEFVLNQHELVTWNVTSGSIVFENIASDSNDNYINVRLKGVVGDFAANNLTIPDHFIKDGKWYKITEIGEMAFANNANIGGSLELGDSLVNICDQAFAYDTSLTSESIVIPKSVKHIGSMAFFGIGFHKFYFESIRKLDIGILPFGYEIASLYVYPSLYNVFCHNKNLIGYEIYKIKNSSNIDEWNYLHENEGILNHSITISDFVSNDGMFSAFNCSPKNAFLNPRLKAQLTCFSDSSFSTSNWLVAQCLNDGNVILRILFDKIPSFGQDFYFGIKIYSDEYPNISFYKYFIIRCSELPPLPTVNYDVIYNDQILLNHSKNNEIDIKARCGSYFYIDGIATSISQHAMPIQNQNSKIQSINKKYLSKIHWDDNNKILKISRNTSNGTASIMFVITSDSYIETYTIKLHIFGNNLPLILGLTIPFGIFILGVLAGLIYFYMVRTIHNKKRFWNR